MRGKDRFVGAPWEVKMRHLVTRVICSAALAGATMLFLPSRCSADFTQLGSAADYAVLGTGGSMSVMSDFAVYQSATVVNGNVGVGPYSTFTHGMDATINGRLDYDTTVTLPSITGTITGGTNQMNMAPIVTAAVNASNTFAALSPTQTFSTLTSGQTITGVAGLNVIQVTGPVSISGGSTSLNFSGPSNAQFVLQLTDSTTTPGHNVLNLSGLTMNLKGGLTSDNILWNLKGSGGDINISSGTALVYGTFLAPDRNITVDNADVFGRVIGGGEGNQLIIHSSSTITGPAVPEFSSIALMSLMLLGFGGIYGVRSLRSHQALAKTAV
jgi:Ice-binding-like